MRITMGLKIFGIVRINTQAYTLQ
ncbi:hypothetical protein A2U01_0021658, partial [Trifolium medium]|nr:hypothetical protein [Trifolium medium]